VWSAQVIQQIIRSQVLDTELDDGQTRVGS